jgi:aromatic ring-opening dioxygenase catalytic subunit (LigB family)
MPVVFACAASHAPGLTAWRDAATADELASVMAGFEQLRASLEEAQPERLLLLTSEHWTNFFLDHVGPFCFGRAEFYEGPVEPWLKLEKRKIPGDPALALRLLNHCYANGFEPNHAHEMKFDHGTMVPLSFLIPDLRIPLVPILFNTLAPPRSRPARCLELGEILRAPLERAPERIAIIATGGMSHDPGERKHGFIDQAFDRTFLDRMSQADLDALASYSEGDLMAAGAGTMELLAWICLAGIMGPRRPSVAVYEPVKAWATGIGLVTYS